MTPGSMTTVTITKEVYTGVLEDLLSGDSKRIREANRKLCRLLNLGRTDTEADLLLAKAAS